MLIPFGVFSAAGAGGGAAAGSYELISTAYGTGASNTITFSSIPSTYKHLQIRWVARTTNAANATEIRYRLNGDSGSNYWSHALVGNGSTVTSTSSTALSAHMSQTFNVSASSTADSFGAGIIDLLDYASTTKNKTVKTFAGYATTANDVRLSSGVWNSTAAVNSFTLTNASSTSYFTTTSRFSLYGIKGD